MKNLKGMESMLSDNEYRVVQKRKQMQFYTSSLNELRNIEQKLEGRYTKESVIEAVKKALVLIRYAIAFTDEGLNEKALCSFKKAEQIVNEVGICF